MMLDLSKTARARSLLLEPFEAHAREQCERTLQEQEQCSRAFQDIQNCPGQSSSRRQVFRKPQADENTSSERPPRPSCPPPPPPPLPQGLSKTKIATNISEHFPLRKQWSARREFCLCHFIIFVPYTDRSPARPVAKLSVDYRF